MNAEAYLNTFLLRMQEEERSRATRQKYEHDIRLFLKKLQIPDADKLSEGFADNLQKEKILLYKEKLKEHYAPASVNSMLVAMNRFLSHIGRGDLTVKLLQIQRKAFRNDMRALSRKDYKKLLQAAKKKDRRLFLLMETICSTGIRVSEHRFITVESLQRGSAEIHNKGKTRTVLLDRRLCRNLKKYCTHKKIKSGPVFVTVSGKPLDRSYIWRMMKNLSACASVPAEKIFPHNLRHLFAVTFYRVTGDIVHLADFLGHTSIDTTRIYTSLSVDDFHHCFARMNLLL